MVNVLTTVGDLVKWARNYGTGNIGIGKAGIGKVGGEALLAAMSQRGALDDGKSLDYGTGLMFGDLDGTPCISHGGALDAYRAELLRVPSADLVVVCLSNRDDMNPSGLARKIAQAVLQAR